MKKHEKKSISATDLGHSDYTFIFVSENLCQTPKKDLRQVVERQKEKQWEYACTRDGKSFARKNDASRVLRMSAIQGIDKVEQALPHVHWTSSLSKQLNTSAKLFAPCKVGKLFPKETKCTSFLH